MRGGGGAGERDVGGRGSKREAGKAEKFSARTVFGGQMILRLKKLMHTP